MKGFQAPCPSCAAPVRFKISSSLVAVCEFCHSVVARTDRKLEDRGKIAAIVETNSPLHLGVKGKVGGKSFELVGRTQYQHAAGGRWDEWYAALSNGKWGWLAEAQGRFYLTTEREFREGESVPQWESLSVGETAIGPDGGTWTVAETGVATPIAAAGEIPFALEPNTAHRYADLYAPGKKFATFDYSDSAPKAYLGREMTLDELGVPVTVLSLDDEDRKIGGVALSCPQCGGSLTLHAPDQAERVGCPSCGALLDCNQGKLEYLKTLHKLDADPLIPLGKVGTWGGVEYTVIGFMKRSTIEEDIEYPWFEYLLYNPRAGFRWLVQSNAQWSFVEPVAPGDVSAGTSSRAYDGTTYKLFQRGLATVRYVVGEFYWRVEVGEEVYTADFIAPPKMLSLERSTVVASPDSEGKPQAQEIQFSLATYAQPEEIEQAFGVQHLPRGWFIAPNRPNPVDWRVFIAWGGFLALLAVVDIVLGSVFHKNGDRFFFGLALVLVSLVPIGTLVYYFNFESSRWKSSNLADSE